MIFTGDQLQRYARQITMPEIGTGGQEKLAAARVLVIGAGGLGSAALLYLAAAGVGTLGIADDDCVELSNLGRQIIHSSSRLDMPKTESAARRIHDLNPDVNVIPLPLRIVPDNILTVIRDYDIVLDCTDRFENKLLINDACVISRTPFVHAGVMRWSGQIMTWLPGSQPCIRCLAGAGAADTPPEDIARAGVLGPVVGILSSMQALEAVKYILGTGQLLTGRMLHVDGMTMTFSETVLPEHSPRCRVCGSHPDITDPAECPEEYHIRTL